MDEKLYRGVCVYWMRGTNKNYYYYGKAYDTPGKAKGKVTYWLNNIASAQQKKGVVAKYVEVITGWERWDD